MHVLVTTVRKRIDVWSGWFEALAAIPGVTLTVLAADVSDRGGAELARLARRHEQFRYRIVPHLFGQDRSGHMASVAFRPRAFRGLAGAPPDVVHILGEPAYLSTGQVIRWCRARHPRTPITVYAAQNIVTGFPFPFPLVERYAYGMVDHAFPITPSALGVLRTKGYSGPATVVPLGVDTTVFRPAATRSSGRPFTVGFVGHLEPHKGIADLLAAAESIDGNLLLVGDGSLRGMVEQAGTRRPGRVELHKAADHEQLPELLRRMDVLVLPSVEVVQRNVLPWVRVPLREQFGRVLIEAMACGVPVVGSDTGDIPHVIGSAGLVFAAGAASELADRLARIRDDPALAARLARAGRERACREFAWSVIAATVHRTWQEMGSRPRAARDGADRRAGQGGAPGCSLGEPDLP